MRATVSLVLAVSLATALSGCTGHTADKPFTVTVRGGGEPCNIEAEGRVVTLQELEAIARPLVKSTQRARISGDRTTTYRCIGGIIYTLQMVGFTDVDATDMLSKRR